MAQKVTVIVPVYNGEAFLRPCVDSILRQTYENLEVILVDDGSTDGSGAICDGYARQDSRVRVFHQENGGVSSARNLGLREATGEYIVFVDADDHVSQSYVSNLMDMPEADYAAAGCFAQDCRGNWSHWKTEPLDISQEQLRQNPALLDRVPTGTVWARRYKMSIIREQGIRFAEYMHRGEDTLFNLNYLLYCDRIAVTEKADYWYHRNPSSVTMQFEPRLFAWTQESLRATAALIGEDNDTFHRRVWNNAMAVCENFFRTAGGCRARAAVFRVCASPQVRRALPWAKKAGQRKRAFLVRFFLLPFKPF